MNYEAERSIAMRNVQVGDVFRVYNHDDIEPVYIMVGVRYDHKALSQSFSTSESVMMARYSATPIYYAVALNGNDAGLISVDGFSNADSRCISAASLIDEIFDTWKHVEKVNFQGVDGALVKTKYGYIAVCGDEQVTYVGDGIWSVAKDE